MVDLETLGNKPGAAIISIGAVAQSDGGVETFKATISIASSIFVGLTVDPDTMSWWRKQSREAWEASTEGGEPLAAVLEKFKTWLQERRASGSGPTGTKLRLWGDSASFDLVLLGCAYRAAGLPTPWEYWEEHCYRTLRNVLGSKKPRAKLQHDSLSDAAAQLSHLKQMLKTLEYASLPTRAA